MQMPRTVRFYRIAKTREFYVETEDHNGDRAYDVWRLTDEELKYFMRAGELAVYKEELPALECQKLRFSSGLQVARVQMDDTGRVRSAKFKGTEHRIARVLAEMCEEQSYWEA